MLRNFEFPQYGSEYKTHPRYISVEKLTNASIIIWPIVECLSIIVIVVHYMYMYLRK